MTYKFYHKIRNAPAHYKANGFDFYMESTGNFENGCAGVNTFFRDAPGAQDNAIQNAENAMLRQFNGE